MFLTGVTVITVDQGRRSSRYDRERVLFSIAGSGAGSGLCGPPRERTAFAKSERFGINVLRSDQQAISEYYARSIENHQHAEQAGQASERTAHGTPVLQADFTSNADCIRHSSGDHTIFIAEGGRSSARGSRCCSFAASIARCRKQPGSPAPLQRQRVKQSDASILLSRYRLTGRKGIFVSVLRLTGGGEGLCQCFASPSRESFKSGHRFSEPSNAALTLPEGARLQPRPLHQNLRGPFSRGL
jgi:hypothetical protein